MALSPEELANQERRTIVAVAILTKTARLRRGVRIKDLSAESITVWNDTPYDKALNEGFNRDVVIRKHLLLNERNR